jgi:ankyrin repeat protein
MYAVTSGCMDTVRAVLEPPNSPSETQETHRLTVSGFLRRCDEFNRSVFHYAAHCGRTNILTYLLDQLEAASKWPEFKVAELDGEPIDPLPPNSLPASITRHTVLNHESLDVAPTLLCQASLGGHLCMVKYLLSKGACDRFSQAPAGTATSSHAEPRQQDTALICAATNGHADIVRAIIASGTYDLAARGQFGEAAVHRAAACKHKDVLQLLLEHGADADAIAEPPKGWSEAERNKLTHYWGGTALLRAAHVGDLERVNMLLEKNAKVSSRIS